MMAKYPVLFIVALLIILAVLPSYCRDDDQPDDVMVFDGKVVSVDIGRSLVTVEGTGTMAFPVSKDTRLQKDVFDIKISDINTGDYVNVGYYTAKGGELKCVSLTVEYGSEDE